MSDKFSLFDLEGAADVIIKFLDMIEKSVGWAISPKGKRLDFEDAIESYKKSLEADESLSPMVRSAKMANVRKELKEYINQGKIIAYSTADLKNDTDPYKIDEDWLAYFFDYAKNISNEDVQKIWGKLLAAKVNGTHNITKKLINIFSLIEQQDIEVFCRICSMTMQNINDYKKAYPIIYIRKFPAYYHKYDIKRYKLVQLDNLGLIEYDTHGKFVLPSISPVLRYGNHLIELESEYRVDYGNVRLTEIGNVLYQMTQIVEIEDFLETCKEMWNKQEIRYEISEINNI